MSENTENIKKVPRRILSSLLSSVSAGVVPRMGAPYIAIGRQNEIEALLSDLEAIDAGEGAMRFLIGRYGSGKSFLMQLVRGYALERGFICADADLSPERRLYGSDGNGVATYRELMKNLASRSSPEGAAMPHIIARWISQIQGESSDSDEGEVLRRRIYNELSELEFLVGGFDFARVISEYYNAYTNDGREKQSACLRWLRGEFASKTEARRELGFSVSVIINDDNWYDFIKLWAVLVKKMGYRGLVVFIDECVNIYKIPNRIGRENNYEKILSIFNDTLQGRAPGLDIVFGGTPQFLEDTRRGLFSYEALRSRLCDSRFAAEGFKNTRGPVIRLCRLTNDELFALIGRITSLYEQYYGVSARISEKQMVEFLNISLSRAGADAMITPREMLRDYMTILNILMQNPDATFSDIVSSVSGNQSTGEPVADEKPAKDKLDDTPRRITTEDIEF